MANRECNLQFQTSKSPEIHNITVLTQIPSAERSPAAATTPSYRDTPGLVFGEHDHGGHGGHDHYGHHHQHHDRGEPGVSRVGGIEDNLGRV